MKNKIYYNLMNKLVVKISGYNNERFIKRLKTNNIDILKLKYTEDSIIIEIKKKDYDKLLSIKTVYNIEILKYKGLWNIKNNLLNKIYIIISILICLSLLFIFTNLIFYVDVITNDNVMKTKILTELKNNNISKYKFKKNYNELEKIKTVIINKYRDEIEWIEIEEFGTKYIIRYEPRIQKNIKKEMEYRNIIARKDSVIKNIYVEQGQIVKSKNTYVKKGDLIVSGYIHLNDSIKEIVSSKGTIYGECWYNVSVIYPLKYYEENETGNVKKVFTIKFFNNELELFNFNKYKNKKVNNKTIIKNNILPIKLIYQIQKEVKIKNDNITDKEAIEKAISYSIKKIENMLDDDEYIYNYKVLNNQKLNNSIKLDIFFSTMENITEYQIIENYKETIN